MASGDGNSLVQEADWLHMDARILGQILSAQNMLFSLPDEKRIADFFSQALQGIPGVGESWVCLGDKAGPAGDRLEICASCPLVCKAIDVPTERGRFSCKLAETQDLCSIAIFKMDTVFGYFLFKVEDMMVFSPYKPFLNNLANYLALSLENRTQKSQLERVRHDLENRVEERTRELSEANAKLVRLSRLYVTLSNVNQSIIRIRGLEELLGEVCRIAVDDGRFMLAWIGLIDSRTNRVEKHLSHGTDDELKKLVDTDLGSQVRGLGPIGLAIATGKLTIFNPVTGGPHKKTWAAKAVECGCHSAAAFPLTIDCKLVGVLSVYSREVDSFGAADIRLLSEMAKDISFALEYMESERRRTAAEHDLQALNLELEQRVNDRTKELAERNAELDRMNRLFVGRELRMAELKERIHQLETRGEE